MRTIACLLVLAAAACDRDSGGNNGNGDGGSGGSDDLSVDQDAFYIQDPPPMYCTLDGGTIPPPPPPGGTLECPDDKNRQGCPCPAESMTASCWPGARKNRNLGICKDGMTTCVRTAEVQLAWGPCVGYVLPVPGAKGRDACECFSQGIWKIDNLSPCFIDNGGGLGSAGAVSTELDGNNVAQCPQPPGTQSSKPWSPDTVTADCAGHFKLCYTLKAGDSVNPKSTDCVLNTSCTEADYPVANVAQKFPDLMSWKSTNNTCATQFASTGRLRRDDGQRHHRHVRHARQGLQPGEVLPALLQRAAAAESHAARVHELHAGRQRTVLNTNALT
jgi:hypothetical protein